MNAERIVSIDSVFYKSVDDIEPFLPLLLLADPSEDLVRGYANPSNTVGATLDGAPVGVYVLLDRGKQLMELKNIAIHPEWQGKGLGKTLIGHAMERAGDHGARRMEVGTGNSSLDQIAFYEKAGFTRDRVDEGFFLRNYAEPIFENGLQCTDMIYLMKKI